MVSHRHSEIQNASYLKQLKELDPDHEIMISTYGASQRKLYQKSVAGLATVGNEEYPIYYKNDSAFNTLGPDGEPYLKEQNSQYSGDSPEGLKKGVGDTQAGASKNHEPANFILQAFNWSSVFPGTGCVYPGYEGQVGLRNITLTHSHAQNLFWYELPGTLGNEWKEPGYPEGSQPTEFVASLAAAINAPRPNSKYWRF